MGVMNVHPPTAAYRALNIVLKMLLELTPCPMPRNAVKHNYFLSATLAQTFNNRSSALTGAAITVPALAEPFIAAGAVVGFLVLFSYRKRTKPPAAMSGVKL